MDNKYKDKIQNNKAFRKKIRENTFVKSEVDRNHKE